MNAEQWSKTEELILKNEIKTLAKEGLRLQILHIIKDDITSSRPIFSLFRRGIGKLANDNIAYISAKARFIYGPKTNEILSNLEEKAIECVDFIVDVVFNFFANNNFGDLNQAGIVLDNALQGMKEDVETFYRERNVSCSFQID